MGIKESPGFARAWRSPLWPSRSMGLVLPHQALVPRDGKLRIAERLVWLLYTATASLPRGLVAVSWFLCRGRSSFILRPALECGAGQAHFQAQNLSCPNSCYASWLLETCVASIRDSRYRQSICHSRQGRGGGPANGSLSQRTLSEAKLLPVLPPTFRLGWLLV
jgi:hypothetical protein